MLLAATSDTRLTDAAMQGNKDGVRSLLKQKADVNAAQGDGMTALHWAAFHDDLETAKLLIAAGANVKAPTRDGAITPLFMACTNGNAAMLEALLKAGAEANSVKANGTTALMTAAASGGAEAVKVLLSHGADVNAKESVHGQTALMFAAALNREAVIKVLLARGADANVATSVRKLERVHFDMDGNIVEDKAAAKTEPNATELKTQVAELQALVQKLVARVDELEKRSGGFKTPGDSAAQADLDAFAHSLKLTSADYRPAKARVKAGDVAARPPRKVGADFMGNMTALLYAAREGHMDAVQALVASGANVNQVNGTKMSPIVMAIINGHYDVAKFLLDHGTDPNLVSETGLTALYAAIDVQWAPKAWFPQPNTEQEKTTYLELMKALLEHGAKVNSPVGEKQWFRSFTNDYTWVDPAGATPFWRAAQSSDTAAMRLLVEHGADPKLATKSGETPLMAAAGIGWAGNWSVNAPYPLVDAVKYCVELGNDVNATDIRGYTALHGAAYLGNNDMVNFLVSKGAKVDVKTKAGDTVADMANGPTRFGQPHPETVALLEKLGSANSHNCRSDLCVVAARTNIYDRPLSPAEQADKDLLDKFAVALGFKSMEYRR
ncbi:MAG: ankyrin repeat domain-containing protein [Bryobacteraceae bacterium]